MVDAADSKSAVRKDVLVRFQSRAHALEKNLYKFIVEAFLFVSVVYVSLFSGLLACSITRKRHPPLWDPCLRKNEIVRQ